MLKYFNSIRQAASKTLIVSRVLDHLPTDFPTRMEIGILHEWLKHGTASIEIRYKINLGLLSFFENVEIILTSGLAIILGLTESVDSSVSVLWWKIRDVFNPDRQLDANPTSRRDRNHFYFFKNFLEDRNETANILSGFKGYNCLLASKSLSSRFIDK